jgi:hypothetical protein
MGSSVAVVGACCEGACREGACCEGVCYKGACREGAYRKGACRKEGSIGSWVDIGGRVGIGASSSKDAFRLFGVPLLLYGALSFFLFLFFISNCIILCIILRI